MAKTTPMRLVELMILKDDIRSVIEFLGKFGLFQFQSTLDSSATPDFNKSQTVFDSLQELRAYLGIDDVEDYDKDSHAPTEEDYESAEKIIKNIKEFRDREMAALEIKKKVSDAYNEANSFANLKVSYSELEHLSFLSLRIGKIDPAVVDELVFNLSNRAVIIPLGDDKSRVLAASSKKGRFALDAELKRYGFIPLEIPKDFKGIPDDVLAELKAQTLQEEKNIEVISIERESYSKTHKDEIIRLLRCMSIGAQVQNLECQLESTQLVYRITGWVPVYSCVDLMKDLDNLTEGRIALRQYEPEEVPSVKEGRETIPVKLTHGKLVGNFQKLIFGFGSPVYGTIDPTPFVAFFFILLFGIMFGDAGQGLVFVLIGILMMKGVIKKFPVSPEFGPIFIAIGCSSTIMGLLTGEFFANPNVLVPFSRFITGLYGEPHDHILHLMPTAESIGTMFTFFLVTIGIGFVINSTGLIINIINQFQQKKYGKAIFGKTGLCGSIFFWYLVFVVIRIFAFDSSFQVYDWIIIGVALFGVFAGHPLERALEKHKPIFPNGVGAGIIEGVVEIIEVVSSYLSNSVSFLRVGAFALAHAVLGFIIHTMMELVGGGSGGIVFSLLVQIVGNVVIIVLEGMIVSIQVIRLQYYEFFSKFFTETGKEFVPFKFKYK